MITDKNIANRIEKIFKGIEKRINLTEDGKISDGMGDIRFYVNGDFHSVEIAQGTSFTVNGGELYKIEIKTVGADIDADLAYIESVYGMYKGDNILTSIKKYFKGLV